MYPRITFHISIKADVEMEYRIEEKGIVHCAGIVKNFGKVIINKDVSHWTEERTDVWKFWDCFLDEGENIIIRDKYKLYRPPFWQVGMDVATDNGDLIVHIGAEVHNDGEG